MLIFKKRKLPIIIPVEVKTREFKSRAILAAKLLEHGHPIYIGSAITFVRDLVKFPPGLIIENDATRKTGILLNRLKKLGFIAVAYDEEALCPVSENWYVRTRICPKTLSKLNKFFTRSTSDKNKIIEEYKVDHKKLVPAGNPRIDILKPQYQSSIDYKNNAEILIISRFSRVNKKNLSKKKSIKNVQTKFNLNSADLAYFIKLYSHVEKIFEGFTKMIPNISKRFPDKNFIIRPHPGEDKEFWLNLIKNLPNVLLSYEGTAEEASISSSLVIQNGCTTAIEAAILGIPVYNFMPVSNEMLDVPLPKLISDCFFNEEELFEAVKSFPKINHNIKDSAKASWNKLSPYIGDENKSPSINVISNEIGKILIEEKIKVPIFVKFFAQLYELLLKIKIKLNKQFLYIYCIISNKKRKLSEIIK